MNAVYCMPGVCPHCLRWCEDSGDVFCVKTGMFVQLDFAPTQHYLGCKQKRLARQREPYEQNRRAANSTFNYIVAERGAKSNGIPKM